MSAHYSGNSNVCSSTSLQIVGLKHALFCGFFCLFLAIGFPLLFLGCNPDLDNMCLTWNVVHGTAYGYKILQQTCQECHRCSRKNDPHCRTCEPEYVCYQGIIDLLYGDPGDNCEYKYDNKYKSAQNALDHMKEDFPLNTTHNFILQKYKDETDPEVICSALKEGKGVWTGGVVLLCLAGVTMIGWIIYAYFSYEDLVALLSTLSYAPVMNSTASASNPNIDSHISHSTTPKPPPYTPTHRGLEMVRAAPTPVADPYQSSANKGSNNPSRVTPYPDQVQKANNAPITFYPITNAATTTAPVASTSPCSPQYTPTYTNVVATPAAATAALPIPMMHTSANVNISTGNSPVYPTCPAVTAYPAATPYNPRAPTAHEEYDMY